MAIEYVKSCSGTFHIPLFNHDNKFCYWISVIQRLHSSPTLNNCVMDFFTSNHDENVKDIFKILLEPIYIYAKLDKTNMTSQDIIKTYKDMNDYMNEYIDERNIIHQCAKNGYIPYYVLCYHYCPIFYTLFINEFENILNEIHIDRTNFETSDDVVLATITDTQPFLKNKEDSLYIASLYSEMIKYIAKNIPEIKLMPFTTATVELTPNKDYVGCHATTLIYGSSNVDPNKDDYFIVDDNRTITPFSEYYKNRKEKIYELALRDINDVISANLNNLLHDEADVSTKVKLSSRITRYVLNFEQNFLSSTDLIIKPERRTNAENLKNNIIETRITDNKVIIQPGGCCDISYSKTFFITLFKYICFGLIMLIIVLVIYRIIHKLKDKNYFEENLNGNT